MNNANYEIRKAANTAGVTFWAIADKLGVSESTMTRKMRRELSADEKQRILTVIAEIATDSGTE